MSTKNEFGYGPWIVMFTLEEVLRFLFRLPDSASANLNHL